jgi:hypothetical protein
VIRKSDRDLALRRQERTEPAKAGLQQRDVCGDEAIEEVAASSPLTLTTPRSGRNAAFIS